MQRRFLSILPFSLHKYIIELEFAYFNKMYGQSVIPSVAHHSLSFSMDAIPITAWSSESGGSEGMSLVLLPPEILINIFSHLDEKDLYVLQQVCKHFSRLINDEELWKNLFISKVHTGSFPSFSQSSKYSTEYLQRLKGLKQWKHNRAVKTKYVLSPSPRFEIQIESLLFDYPRCACYNDGIITLVQLHSKRKKDRLIYIPCTTPQGCSTMNFNMNAAVFGRFDGRVFGKLLSNKSYLTPVTEFDFRHSACVTAITTSSSQGSFEDWCVSGSENGEVIWWCETKRINFLKVSNKAITHVALFKSWTIVLDEEKIYVIHEMNNIHVIKLPKVSYDSCEEILLRVQFFKVDFGSMSLILADTNHLFVISFDPNQNFNYTRSIEVPELINKITLDEVTSLREQNPKLAGGDGCHLAIMTMKNTINIINVRAPGNTLKIENVLEFDGHIFTCQVTNLVIVCALGGKLQIFDATSAQLIKTVQKTEPNPQFLAISQGRMVIGSGNVVHYLQYISESNYDKRRGTNNHHSHSGKRESGVDVGLAIYDEEKYIRSKQRLESERLLETYGGDMSDEELQLKIALMESDSIAQQENKIREAADDDLRRAFEASTRTEHNQSVYRCLADEGDQEFLAALECSAAEEQDAQERSMRRARRDGNASRELQSREFDNNPDVELASSREDDEALQLAIALSLSEMN